jgi:hypothetical protein
MVDWYEECGLSGIKRRRGHVRSLSPACPADRSNVGHCGGGYSRRASDGIGGNDVHGRQRHPLVQRHWHPRNQRRGQGEHGLLQRPICDRVQLLASTFLALYGRSPPRPTEVLGLRAAPLRGEQTTGARTQGLHHRNYVTVTKSLAVRALTVGRCFRRCPRPGAPLPTTRAWSR